MAVYRFCPPNSCPLTEVVKQQSGTRYPHAYNSCVSGDVPPIPPHITLEQAKAYASALVKGDPDEAGIIKQTVKDVASGIFHRKGAEKD
ncbi:MAG TPA: hypothetical protein VGT44_01965 [Ktedonobacteraceae bacterium]|nr:hypothetical protein [Ktedonobacteraceae bacterium]